MPCVLTCSMLFRPFRYTGICISTPAPCNYCSNSDKAANLQFRYRIIICIHMKNIGICMSACI